MQTKLIKPAAPRTSLLLLSGIMWSIVGILLGRMALSWYLTLGFGRQMLWLLLSIPLAIAIHRFGFSKLAVMNVRRIQALAPKPCIFAFMQWWNYPLVLFMISLGIWMRHSPIPKQHLGILYLGIGLALFLGSLHYYWALVPGRSMYQQLSSQSPSNPTADSGYRQNIDVNI